MTPLGKAALLCLLLLAAVSSSPTTTTSQEDSVELPDAKDDDDDDDEDWRDNTLVYHIRPRSFQDSNGDGEGDLRGIISRLDYLVGIGIDTIRLSPIYLSSNKDSGYHILNHTDIDPTFGDFDDFDELVQEVHEKGLKIILDVVPNQSSNEHEWFLSSATNTEPYDDYYIWADGRYIDNKVIPPNDWKSVNSDDEGSAWTWSFKKRMWYYHKFNITEPDLNLRNEDVVEDIMEIFDFWLERDVDGFCICGVSYLYEYQDLKNEPDEENDFDGDGDADFSTVGLAENAILLQRIRKHIDDWVKDNNETQKLLIGEVDELDDEIMSYYGNETDPGIIPLNLILILEVNDTSNAGDIKNVVEDWMERLPEGAETNWQLSNQDNSRAASKFDADSLDGLTMLTLLLPGQTITYYGEEIGMKNYVNASLSEADENDDNDNDNDNDDDDNDDDDDDDDDDQFRTPMQWDNSISAGFSTNDSTFLPVHPDYSEINVEKQLQDADSNLRAYKTLTSLRELPIFEKGDYDLDAVNEDNVLILKRSYENDTCLVTINFGSSKETLNLTALYPDLEEDLFVIVDSSNTDVESENDEDDDDDIENDLFVLGANAAAVLCEKDYFPKPTSESPTSANDNGVSEETISTQSDRIESAVAEPTTNDSGESEESDDDDSSSSAIEKRPLYFMILVNFSLTLLLRTL